MRLFNNCIMKQNKCKGCTYDATDFQLTFDIDIDMKFTASIIIFFVVISSSDLKGRYKIVS